ncbi:MAG: hypothetical protein ACE5FK_03890, partial [Candidatus Methylomirabilia bacterium]
MTAQAPDETAALRALLTDPSGAKVVVNVGRHGTITCLTRAVPRRTLEFDREGTLLTVASWDEAGRPRWAKLKLPDRRWVGIEPRSQQSPIWGESDRLWLLAEGARFRPVELLSHFQAVDYQAVRAIPPLAEPQRLPPGAGSAVLNFLACLLEDQGTREVHYRGPYPTEQLFTSLLESHRYEASVDDPLERFMESALPWIPAPHERQFLPGGIYIQLRDSVEKVVLGGKAYYQLQWQSVLRREPRVIRQDGDRLVCSLWALGEPVEDHLILDRAGEVVERRPQSSEAGPTVPLSPGWRKAIRALIAQQTAPPLRPWIEEAQKPLMLDWGPVNGDLLEVQAARVILSLRLPRLFRSQLARCHTLAERLQLALRLITEVSRLLGPTIRLRAQDRL